MMDEQTQVAKLDSTHPLWEPAHRCGEGRLSMQAFLALAQSGSATPDQRLVLLAMFALAEIESYSGDGYNGTRPEDLVLWTGMDQVTIGRLLGELHDGAWIDWVYRESTGEWRYHLTRDAEGLGEPVLPVT